MPLLSFEGVEVEVPTELHGIRFVFSNGTLSIQCTNFSGSIVMAKPARTTSVVQEPLTLSAFPVVAAAPTAKTPQQLIIQTSQSSSLSSFSASKKRSNLDGQSESDMVVVDSDDSDRESELTRKRLRPNFLSDVEQTMLLAQLETSQPSQRSSSVDMVDATQAEPVAEPAPAVSTSPERLVNEAAQPDLKTPAKAKKPAVSHMKSFFSPEPKEPAAKKTPESSGKKGTVRSPGVKAKADSTQVSIRDMMRQTTLTKPPDQPTLTAAWSVLETSGAAPSERWGHTVTPISENRVVVYGGADDNESTLGDLHVFDVAANAWSKPLNCESIPRTWHDAVYLESKHLMLVFGGERVVANDQLDVLSDIMVLDTECFLWYPPAVSGVPPTARSGHSCTVVGNDVVVFGGSRGRSRQSSVHVLDSDSWHWKQVKTEGKPPSARTYHSAVAVGGDSVVYFGGNDSKKSFDSVHVLKKSEGKNDVWTWFHPCVVGNAPRGRTGQSATLVDDSKILIFGGWDPQNEDQAASATIFNDAFLLNTVTWEWEAVQLETQSSETGEGETPTLPGRVGHSTALVKDNTVLLFGGQDAMDKRLNVVHALALRKSSGAASS